MEPSADADWRQALSSEDVERGLQLFGGVLPARGGVVVQHQVGEAAQVGVQVLGAAPSRQHHVLTVVVLLTPAGERWRIFGDERVDLVMGECI